jgi:hypothetical protein
MTNQETSDATNEAAADARANGAHRLLLLLGITGVLGVLVLAAALLWQNAHINGLRDAGNTTASQAQQLAQQVRSLGGTPVVTPATPGPQGPTGAQGPGPSDAQIADAVTRYLQVHPPAAGQPATPAMVATAVAAYLTVNPPQPGRAPTAQEITTATSTYLATHPTEFQGVPGAAGAAGQNGVNGKDATDAQVAAAVDAYCSIRGACVGTTGAMGQAGDQGQQGVSVTDVAPVRRSDGSCVWVVSLHDPATGKDSTVTHPANDVACPLFTTNSTKGAHG